MCIAFSLSLSVCRLFSVVLFASFGCVALALPSRNSHMCTLVANNRSRDRLMESYFHFWMPEKICWMRTCRTRQCIHDCVYDCPRKKKCETIAWSDSIVFLDDFVSSGFVFARIFFCYSYFPLSIDYILKFIFLLFSLAPPPRSLSLFLSEDVCIFADMCAQNLMLMHMRQSIFGLSFDFHVSTLCTHTDKIVLMLFLRCGPNCALLVWKFDEWILFTKERDLKSVVDDVDVDVVDDEEVKLWKKNGITISFYP